jgi:hypothetical protein
MQPNPEETVIVLGLLRNAPDARLSIEVRDAGGRSAGRVAKARLAAFSGFAVEQSTLTLDSPEAFLLEPVPGQELSRQAFATQTRLLHTLTFTSADPESSACSDILALYDLVIGSWTFLSPRSGADLLAEQPLLSWLRRISYSLWARK